jgi:threonine/homoserine/homoserine lactone efflux protein
MLQELILFVLLMVATPGPGNILAMTGGLTFGFRGCFPFVLGLIVGFALLNISVGVGLGSLITENFYIRNVFKIIGCCYIIYLAICTWNTPPQAENITQQNKLSFYKGLLVHPVSIKTWMMLTITYSEYTTYLVAVEQQIIYSLVCFASMQLIFHNGYCLAGVLLGKTFSNNLYLNRVMSVLIILVMVYTLLI